MILLSWLSGLMIGIGVMKNVMQNVKQNEQDAG